MKKQKYCEIITDKRIFLNKQNLTPSKLKCCSYIKLVLTTIKPRKENRYFPP